MNNHTKAVEWMREKLQAHINRKIRFFDSSPCQIGLDESMEALERSEFPRSANIFWAAVNTGQIRKKSIPDYVLRALLEYSDTYWKSVLKVNPDYAHLILDIEPDLSTFDVLLILDCGSTSAKLRLAQRYNLNVEEGYTRQLTLYSYSAEIFDYVCENVNLVERDNFDVIYHITLYGQERHREHAIGVIKAKLEKEVTDFDSLIAFAGDFRHIFIEKGEHDILELLSKLDVSSDGDENSAIF
jgi:hypothetical protein